MNIDEMQAERKLDETFSEWRRAEIKKLPELAARVFALRGTGYPGCGYHWSMERDLGWVICRLSNYDDRDCLHGPEKYSRRLMLEVNLEMLYEDVEKAEQAIRDKMRKIPPGLSSGA